LFAQHRLPFPSETNGQQGVLCYIKLRFFIGLDNKKEGVD